MVYVAAFATGSRLVQAGVAVNRQHLISRVALSFVVGMSANTVSAIELSDFFKRADQRAAELLENGQVDEATALFKDEQWRGVSHYRSGNYQDAMEAFEGLEDAKSLYNHGTASVQAGDYDQAIASLEAASALAPEDEKIQQNLEIARKLKELAESQAQEPPDNQGDQQQEDQQSEEERAEPEQPDDQQGDQQQGDESSESEPSESDNQSSSSSDESQQQEGELDSSQQAPESQSDGEADELRELMQEQTQNAESDDSQQGEPNPVDTEVSEDDQATQQWLRRIPDDASQLLRNKIRLNHLIEYPEVNDMQDPW